MYSVHYLREWSMLLYPNILPLLILYTIICKNLGVAGQSIFNKFLTPYTNAVGTVDEISKVGLCEYTGIGVYLCIIYGTDSPKEYYWIGYIVSNGKPEGGQKSIKLANNDIEISMGWYYRPYITTEATNLKSVSYKIA